MIPAVQRGAGVLGQFPGYSRRVGLITCRLAYAHFASIGLSQGLLSDSGQATKRRVTESNECEPASTVSRSASVNGR